MSNVFSLGQRVVFVFGYCMGVPNYDEGVVTKVVDAEWITVECGNPDVQSRIPLNRGGFHYSVTVPVCRILKPDDEQRVIDAWYHFFRSDTPVEKRVDSEEILLRTASSYPYGDGRSAIKDYMVHLE